MKITKTFLTGAVALAGFISMAGAAVIDVDVLLASQAPTFVHVDQCAIDFVVPPVIVNSRTFVEISTLSNRLDIALEWRQSDQRVTGTASNGSVFHLYIGSLYADVNGQSVILDAAPFIAANYNRTMIPLSFVAKATGAQVIWRNAPRTADIYANKNKMCALTEMHRMVDFVFRGYYDFGQAGPIAITPAKLINATSTQSVYLIGLAGTDLGRLKAETSATGIWEDFLVGAFNLGNSYEEATVSAILNHIPQGSKLILSGHSLGGMIAQEIAADSRIKDKYVILNTITFGSPLISALSGREGTVKRMGDFADAVPLLSVDGTVLLPWQVAGLNIRDGGYGPFGLSGAHNESYRRYNVWHGFDALGFENGSSSVTFYPSDLRYYAAPR